LAELRVCTVSVAPVLRDPEPGSEQVTQALLGEPLSVEEWRDGWARVRTVYDSPGWIAAHVVAPGGEPVEVARSYLGAPYLWGGLTEEGIDCSGLVHMAFRRLGCIVPRDAWQQEEAALEVGEPQPGDLVTYGDPGARADHIAFWLGDGRILHATAREAVGKVVEEGEPAPYSARRRKFVRF